MSIGSSFGDALRSSGKHVASHAVKKSFSGYAKANKKVKAKGIAHFKALVTKSERNASKSRNVKRSKQSRSLKAIK